MTLKSGEVYFSGDNAGLVFPESVSVFGFSISFFGLFLVLAAVTGIFVSVKEAKRKKQNIERMLTLLTWVVVSAVVGARLYYVMFQWQSFLRNPLEVFYIRNGGLSYYGALFGVWFVAKWYCGRKEMDFLHCADTLSLGAAVAAPLVWLGCALGREPIGRFSQGVFSVKLDAAYIPEGMETEYAEQLLSRSSNLDGISYVSVHPVALYGVALSLAVAIGLLVLNRKGKRCGAVFSVYLLSVSAAHFILECFRGDRCYIWGTQIPANCVVAVVISAAIATGWYRNRFATRKKEKKSYKNINEV